MKVLSYNLPPSPSLTHHPPKRTHHKQAGLVAICDAMNFCRLQEELPKPDDGPVVIFPAGMLTMQGWPGLFSDANTAMTILVAVHARICAPSRSSSFNDIPGAVLFRQNRAVTL